MSKRVKTWLGPPGEGELVTLTEHAARRAQERLGWSLPILKVHLRDGGEVIAKQSGGREVVRLACGAYLIVTMLRPGHERRRVLTVLPAWMSLPNKRAKLL